jgi:hypothetical protein
MAAIVRPPACQIQGRVHFSLFNMFTATLLPSSVGNDAHAATRPGSGIQARGCHFPQEGAIWPESFRCEAGWSRPGNSRAGGDGPSAAKQSFGDAGFVGLAS